MKNTITLFALLITTLLGNAQIYESYKHVPDIDPIGAQDGWSLATDGEWAVGAPNQGNTGWIYK